MGLVAYCNRNHDVYEVRVLAEEEQPVGCERGNLHTLALSVLRSFSSSLAYM